MLAFLWTDFSFQLRDKDFWRGKAVTSFGASRQKMAVKAAIALAELSALGPIHKCLNRQEDISNLGSYLEINRAKQPKEKAGHQSRGEGWEEWATGLSRVQGAPKSLTFDLFLVCH